MIIVKLIGGLGNQMFQYAVGRCLAHKCKTELKLDIQGFNSYKLRNYDLNHFNIVENFVTFTDLAQVSFDSDRFIVKLLNNIVSHIPSVKPIEYIKEEKLSFQQKILGLSGNVYLDGYWQNERYFLEIKDIIIKEFSIVSSLSSMSQDIEEQVKDCESVSIHVRRGDYVSDPKTNSFHGTCGLEYYYKAINMIYKTVDNPHFFIFSDDPEWASCNIQPKEPTTYIRHNNSSKDYEDMYLMSMCKHHIIANSSFSWWGAWLSSYKKKIVVAPKRWFFDEKANGEYELPEGWVRL